MVTYDDYIFKDEKGKSKFWDMMSFSDCIEKQDSESLYIFLKEVILNSTENIFSRMQAMKSLLSLTHMDKIKERKTIAVLLDDMDNLDSEMLVCYRLKYMTLFYEKEKSEIKSIFLKYLDDKSDLVKAEARYQLALTMFYDSNVITDKDEYLNAIHQTCQIFEEVINYEDNRFDAKILGGVCNYIISSFSMNIEEANCCNQKIQDQLLEVLFHQLDETLNTIYFRIGNNISRIHTIIQNKTDNWLDYRDEFNKLCADFYELFNIKYKESNFFDNIFLGVNDKFKNKVIEPVFKYNYKATISKINAILSEEGTEENTITFLKYLKKILVSKEVKAVDINEQNLKENFPMLTEEDIDSFQNSLNQSNVSEAIYKIVNAVNKFSPRELLNSVIIACIKLQANHYYKDCKEDIRNDYIRDLLRTKGYQVLDQSRQGFSEKGKDSGEVDLLFLENDIPCALLEALNLDSLNKNYLNIHIDKIYKYDTLGNNLNFLVSYVTVVDFNKFWDNYKTHISNYEYHFPLMKVDEMIKDNYQYSNLKVIATEHIRNGESTILYHICVLM